MIPLKSVGPWTFSSLTLGTAALAQDYAGQAPVPPGVAQQIVFQALEAGCTLIDTAPGYGSETIVGQALARHPYGSRCWVSTKVSPALSVDYAMHQMDHSRMKLMRDTLDMVLLHNPHPDDFYGGTWALLLNEKARGAVRFVGASVYTVDEALTALHRGADVIQVPFNLMDQRMAQAVGWGSVLTRAQERTLPALVMARSPWLRGALAPSGAALPKAVERASQRVRRLLLQRHWLDLADLALRFCLQQPGIATVVIGPRRVVEMLDAIRTAERSIPLGWYDKTVAPYCASADPNVYDPRRWPDVPCPPAPPENMKVKKGMA